MTGNLAQDWPVYVLLGAVVFFFTFVIIKGNMQGRDSKESKEEDKLAK